MSWWPCADPLCSVSSSLEQHCRCCLGSEEKRELSLALFSWQCFCWHSLVCFRPLWLSGIHQGLMFSLWSPGPSELSRGFSSFLGSILPLSFPVSRGSSAPFPAASLGCGEGQPFSQTCSLLFETLTRAHSVFSRSHWNCLGLHFYRNGKWAKLNFIFSMSWETQYFSLRCNQTKSLLRAEVFVQLYSVQPEILITDVRYLFFLGVFSYLVCNESASRRRKSFYF